MTDDLTFPWLHGRPRRGWINDPNGLCRIDGTYHVFFQHHPDAPTHGDIAWGHVSSTDLLRWDEQPVALVPRPGEVDAAGCWSGCVVVDDGVPTAVYTAVRAHSSDAWVTLAVGGPDLREWVQGPGIVPTPGDPALSDVRDPFVFWFDGARYAVQGAGRASPDGRPQLLAYRCADLSTWTPLGPLLTDDDPVAAEVAEANIWECPNLFELDGRWVAVVSLWRADVDGGSLLVGVRYLVGDLAHQGDGLRFTATSGGTLDEGPAFYAPQVLVAPDRVLLWGWAWELGRSVEQVAAAGWAGSLTFPRELSVRDGELRAVPAAELTELRQEGLDPTEITARAFELTADGPIGLLLGEQSQVVVDPGFFAGGPARILVDGSVVEAYGSGRTLTTRAYPSATSSWRVSGSATVHRLGLD